MLSLIVNTLLPQWKLGLFILPAVCVALGTFQLQTGSPVGFIGLTIPTYMSVIRTLAEDYRYSPGRYFLALPVSRRSWVAARYLSVAIVFAASLAFAVAFGLIGRGLGLPVAPPSALMIVLTGAMVAVYIAALLPLDFAFGYTKSSWFNVIIICLTAGGTGIAQAMAGTAASDAKNLATPLTAGLTQAALSGVASVSGVIALASAALLGLSFALSVRLFSKRDF